MAHSKLELNVDLRKSEEVASVSFSAEEGRGPQPRLRDLAHLLNIVEDVSPKFKSLNVSHFPSLLASTLLTSASML